MKKILFTAIVLITSLAFAKPEAGAVIDSVKSRLSLIEDYSVRVKLSVKMPKFRMPRKKIDIYFKQPDKFKLEADGFAVVPRQALGTNAVLDSLTGLSVTGSDTVDGQTCWMVRGDRQEGDFTLNTVVWIDDDDWLIRRAVSNLDTVEVFNLNIEYGVVDKEFLMPVKTTVIINTAREMVGQLGHYDPDRHGNSPEQQLDESMKNGEVTMEFSRYKINRGIKDRVFRDSDL